MREVDIVGKFLLAIQGLNHWMKYFREVVDKVSEWTGIAGSGIFFIQPRSQRLP
jgi:hypothetical protein